MSAPTAGNFDCHNLPEVKLKAEQMFRDDVRQADYVAHSAVAKAVLGMQTADLRILEDPEKDREVKLTWIADCDTDAPEDCNRECVIDGAEIGDMCENKAITRCFEKSWSITERQFRTSSLSPMEVAAVSLNKKRILMDNEISRATIEFFVDNSGVNLFDTSAGGQYTVSGDVTYIPPAAWNPDLFGYFTTVQARNEYSLGKLFLGTQLYQYYWKVQQELTNPTGASEARKMGAFGEPVFDLSQLDTEVGTPAAFLVNPNSVAIATKAEFKNYGAKGRDEVAQGHATNYSVVASPTLPGVVYDLTYQKQCIDGRDWKHVWKLELRWDIFLNPLGCTNERTGILQFLCGTGS